MTDANNETVSTTASADPDDHDMSGAFARSTGRHQIYIRFQDPVDVHGTDLEIRATEAEVAWRRIPRVGERIHVGDRDPVVVTKVTHHEDHVVVDTFPEWIERMRHF